MPILDDMINGDSNIYTRLHYILHIFEILEKGIRPNIISNKPITESDNDNMKLLIEWTEKNLGSRITIEDAATQVHLSR